MLPVDEVHKPPLARSPWPQHDSITGRNSGGDAGAQRSLNPLALPVPRRASLAFRREHAAHDVRRPR